jgi:hypothetical protein
MDDRCARLCFPAVIVAIAGMLNHPGIDVVRELASERRHCFRRSKHMFSQISLVELLLFIRYFRATTVSHFSEWQFEPL